ncbi:ROK family protein [Pasteurella multocida]|uniref:ROK family protein n=1 Tax=Pasteurella multocida TaxID=747 RepID=UPI000DF87C83|nr:ROK family protein [Pasteurella multocida]MCL7785880.1 ROK family protein [Pasteurella multocida]MCL7796034.1 ROK family protein [Pasteurella multocida]URI03234.1 ROK family protein [Pasteurella multocida]SUB46818.1 protein Mlc [Pasteurella multocida subsp. septica]HDR1228591.1 ROK family protein [Pasteurella multocida]
MPKIRKEDKLPLRLTQLGKIYRLVEQFEEISRIDLSKLSRLAPATITALTRELIKEKLIVERAVQNTESRGRPAIGLCVSPFYWQSLCATLVENRFELILSELDGGEIKSKSYPLTTSDLVHLDQVLVQYLQQFLFETQHELNHLITFSIAVGGELDSKNRLIKLGDVNLDLDLESLFKPYFKVPVLVTEYFQTWLMAESTLGSVINCDNVLFLQLDDVINFNVLSKGELLTHQHQVRSHINKMIVPKISPLQDLISPHLADLERYQLQHQVTHKAIYPLITHYFPEAALAQSEIEFLCQKANAQNPQAQQILHYVADSLAYILMNLVNIFDSEKIMLSSSFLSAKEVFLPRVNQTLKANLGADYPHVEVITGRYEWNTPVVAAAAIKQGIYDGSLLGHFIKH